MSFTEVEHVFAGVHETALNDVLQAFCQARPRHLFYGSPAFVPFTTAAATRMDAISFPGIAGGIEWSVAFATPVVDLFGQSSPLPPELALAPGQLSVRTAVKLCIDCKHRLEPPKGPRKDPRKDDNDHNPDRPKRQAEGATCAVLEVFGIGHLEVVNGPGGTGSVRVRIDAVELVDITPDDLESVLECLIVMLLDAALSEAVLPLEALRAGAFSVILQRGPEVEDDQIKVYGDV